MAQVNKENIHLGLADTFWVYVSYVVLLFFGHARDWVDDLMGYRHFVTVKVRRRARMKATLRCRFTPCLPRAIPATDLHIPLPQCDFRAMHL